MQHETKRRRSALVATTLATAWLVSPLLFLRAQSDDPLAAPLEAAVRKRDGQRLDSLKTQLEQRIRQNTNDAQSELSTCPC